MTRKLSAVELLVLVVGAFALGKLAGYPVAWAIAWVTGWEYTP